MRKSTRHTFSAALALGTALLGNASLGHAQEQAKPNILFIMGDDIGWMQPSIYHRGLMVGETPNIDRIGKEGALFTDYYAEQSCTAGRTAFITGMNPLRVGMLLPEIPGSPSYLRAGTPTLAKFLYDLGYNTGEFGKNHLGDTTESLPTAHGFQEFWGYLYHLDAMQGVSFPDINKSPTEQAVAPPCQNTPIPGLPEVPGAVDPKTTVCLTPPRPVICVQVLRRHAGQPELPGRGSADTRTLEDGVDEEISAKVIDFLDRNDPKKTNKPFFVWYNPARMHITTVLPRQIHGHGRRARRQGLGRQRSRHEADGRQHRLRAREAGGDGPARQHHRRLHHRQRRRDHHLPGRRHHPVQGRQADHLGRRHARADGRALAGPHRAGNGQDRHLRLARLAADVRRHRRRPEGRRAEERDRGGQYPGIVKTTLDGIDQRDYLEGKSEKSARDHFFYYSGKDPSAVRYKNWKMYFAMVSDDPAGFITGVMPYQWTQVVNIKRDPFETSVGKQIKTLFGMGGAIAATVTAYIYDWNILPIGQALWLKELETYIAFPPLQNPASYNLEQVMQQVREMKTSGGSD